jgi:hypothetical protein
MKIIFREHRNQGLMRNDVLMAVLLVFLLFAILFAMILPVNEAARRRAQRITCVANLRQVGMALRVWEDDNGSINRNDNTNRLSTAFLETNAQTVGLNAGQIAWINAMGITNFARSTTFLQCPADRETQMTTNSAGVKIRISYFLNLDANESYPQQLMAGDDNLTIGGVPVKPGILILATNTLAWTGKRHRFVGNIALADGSVDQVSPLALQNAAAYSLPGTPYSTNRLAIP